jgi:hypothetical protein
VLGNVSVEVLLTGRSRPTGSKGTKNHHNCEKLIETVKIYVKIDKATISGDKNHHSLLLVKEVSTKSTNTDKSNNSNKSQMVSTGTNTASTDFLTNTISSRKRSRESSIQDDDEIIVSSENEFNSLTKSQNKIKFFFKNFITPSPGK